MRPGRELPGIFGKIGRRKIFMEGSARVCGCLCLALSSYMVVLSWQYAESMCFFSSFSAGGLHDWGILLVISLKFQEIKHQPFSMTQP